MRKETTRRSACAGFHHRSFPADHALTHNEHPRAGYRTLRFAPRPIVLLGRRVIASRVPRPRAPGRSGPPRMRVAEPGRSAALFSLAAAARRQGPHCSRGFRRRPPGLSPLTARFAAALPRASRSRTPRLVDITNHSLHFRMDELDELETQARAETVCRGCGGEKEAGLIVCWPCFKYREDVVPFKYFDGTLSQWLQRV